jgi:hypothetical protein
VLGVGSIPSVTLGSSGYQSQSTTVPVNGAYILAEDQNGVGAQFGASRNYFDYGSGTKNTIAQTSENFVTTQGYFSTAEQGSLVSQQLTGVCSSSSSGCTGSYGVQTSINSYKFYPLSSADIISRTSSYQNGKFFNALSTEVDGARISTLDPRNYWTRSPDRADSGTIMSILNGNGNWFGDSRDHTFGFRPAGVFNLKALNVCLPQTFRLGNCLKIVSVEKI